MREYKHLVTFCLWREYVLTMKYSSLFIKSNLIKNSKMLKRMFLTLFKISYSQNSTIIYKSRNFIKNMKKKWRKFKGILKKDSNNLPNNTYEKYISFKSDK